MYYVDHVKNLTQNQHGTFTYRKLVNNHQIRISLKTSDKLEAIRITDKASALLSVAQSNDPHIIKTIVTAFIVNLSSAHQKDRVSRVQSFLSSSLTLDIVIPLSELIQRFTDKKIRSDAWASKTPLIYRVYI